ncbi:T9SS type A sorting domain-containing protein, partial [candidate division KSB1 bacterium]|nr:T9SS type A sorting domain-containing protein [candidate division KSB1 bacterium]
VVEVFIDENKSGGLHVFDGTGNVAAQWGSNAENAFSYHITPVVPADGEVSNSMVACDIAGTNWGNYYIPDYADHLPEFALKRNGNQYVWEFSLIVYNDSFDHNNPAAARIQLQAGKFMGLSLAYCDNDDPNEDPKKRDNFFGSVWVPQSAYNDHWMNADGFGTIMLMGESTGVGQIADEPAVPEPTFQLYPNPSQGDIRLMLENNFRGQVNIAVYDVLGREVLRTAFQKQQIDVRKLISARHLAAGVYFIKAEMAGQQQVQKMMILYQ